MSGQRPTLRLTLKKKPRKTLRIRSKVQKKEKIEEQNEEMEEDDELMKALDTAAFLSRGHVIWVKRHNRERIVTGLPAAEDEEAWAEHNEAQLDLLLRRPREKG